MQSLGKAPGTRETFFGSFGRLWPNDTASAGCGCVCNCGVCVCVYCMNLLKVHTLWQWPLLCRPEILHSTGQLIVIQINQPIKLFEPKYPCYNIVWDLYLQSTSLNYHSIWWISLSDGGICQFITMNRISLLYYFVDWIVFFRFKYEGGGQLSDMSCPPNDLQTVHQLLEVS